MPLQRTKSAVEAEAEAVGKLTTLFENLMAMKADKTTYIKSAQVLQPYDELSRIVRPLLKYEKDLLVLQDGKSKGIAGSECFFMNILTKVQFNCWYIIAIP